MHGGPKTNKRVTQIKRLCTRLRSPTNMHQYEFTNKSITMMPAYRTDLCVAVGRPPYPRDPVGLVSACFLLCFPPDIFSGVTPPSFSQNIPTRHVFPS